MHQQKNIIHFPAEWEIQSGVQLTWPHADTDWRNILDEVIPCFISIAIEIAKHEKIVIVCKDKSAVIQDLSGVDTNHFIFYEIPTNDTWARDHAPISVHQNQVPTILDFTFNGWGLQFAANFDNLITRQLYKQHAYASQVVYQNRLDFVLEGGSIESDGAGTLLTTAQCLLSPNRNEGKSQDEIEAYLKTALGIDRILWLHHGYLAGDDTGSHIDTLARFCSKNTITYVKCEDPNDEHYTALAQMEKELQHFRTSEEKPYELIPLPMADPVCHNGERLPATYANFLIINDAILMPTYHSTKDSIAMVQLQKAFPDREIIGINCLPLIKQHGSLHCVTMQYPYNFL